MPESNCLTRYALAGGVGLMLAAAFPKPGLAALAWLAPGLWLALAMGQSSGAAFRIGYVGGMTFHLAALYWLLYIPVPVAPIFGWLALGAYLALFQGAWVWLAWKIYEGTVPTHHSGTIWQQFLINRWSRQLIWCLGCAALWVAGEMIQARLFTGMPWNLLGVSQFRMTPLIQIASVTGVYGLSFLMVWFSVTLVSTGALLVFRPDQPRDWMAEMFAPMIAIVVVTAYGMRILFYVEEDAPTLKLTLVQPNVPQTVIWDADQSMNRFHALLDLSRHALTNRPDVLVWPEAAVPNLFRYDTNVHMAVTNLARHHQVWMVLGADDVIQNQNDDGTMDYRYYNCSFVVNPLGGVDRVYRKRKLVVFGEYVPLARWLPFLRDFTSVTGDFTPGEHPVPFIFSNLNVRTSVLICFEDIFPHLAGEYVREDTDFLLNLTNNGWFGESAAQWQHAAMAVFRAVEHRIPLVRCANNGLTCWVDAWGRMRSVFFPDSKNVYQRGIKTVRVPVLAGSKRTLTIYGRYGDWFGWTCVVWTALLLLWRFVARSRA